MRHNPGYSATFWTSLVTPPPPACALEGCGEPPFARGFCQRHYRAWRFAAKMATGGRLFTHRLPTDIVEVPLH